MGNPTNALPALSATVSVEMLVQLLVIALVLIAGTAAALYHVHRRHHPPA